MRNSTAAAKSGYMGSDQYGNAWRVKCARMMDVVTRAKTSDMVNANSTMWLSDSTLEYGLVSHDVTAAAKHTIGSS